MTKVIVTGGAGFIGSHLVDSLVAAKHEVIVIDNLVAGQREQLNPAATFFQLDVRATDKLTTLGRGADCIFHLAALPRVAHSVADPIGTHETNVNGTLSVLLAARAADVPRVIFASSSAVYGPTTVLPIREDHPTKPISPYALHKLIGEHYCAMFNQLYNLETVCLRAFNVYGPREDGRGSYATVIGKFRDQRQAGQPLLIFGDGQQTRDFIHVDDLVRAYRAALVSDRVGRGDIINICAGQSYAINDIAALIGGPRQYQPARPGDVPHTLGDFSRARELLGWEPKISLAAGIAALLA